MVPCYLAYLSVRLQTFDYIICNSRYHKEAEEVQLFDDTVGRHAKSPVPHLRTTELVQLPGARMKKVQVLTTVRLSSRVVVFVVHSERLPGHHLLRGLRPSQVFSRFRIDQGTHRLSVRLVRFGTWSCGVSAVRNNRSFS